MKKLFAVLMIAALAVGCCSACRMRVKNAKPLEGTVWHLVKVGGESFTLPTDEFNIILNENNLGGRGACNSLLGQYATGDKFALRFSHLGSTKMLCPHNEALEMKLIQILSQTTHYDIDYDMLMLMRDGTILAVFQALQPTIIYYEKNYVRNIGLSANYGDGTGGVVVIESKSIG